MQGYRRVKNGRMWAATEFRVSRVLTPRGHGLGFRVLGSRFRVQGLGFRVWV